MPLFLKIDTIPGESRSDKHGGEIEVSSFQIGAGNVDALAGKSTAHVAPSGSSTISEMVFTSDYGIASPILMKRAVDGTSVGNAVLTAVTAGGEQREYLRVTMTNCAVAGDSLSSGGDRPSESFSLRFASIRFDYTAVSESGKIVEKISRGDLSASKR
jgi:type VI secretion system secreted protein Hcp